jgi:hypothetical protein
VVRSSGASVKRALYWVVVPQVNQKPGNRFSDKQKRFPFPSLFPGNEKKTKIFNRGALWCPGAPGLIRQATKPPTDKALKDFTDRELVKFSRVQQTGTPPPKLLVWGGSGIAG